MERREQFETLTYSEADIQKALELSENIFSSNFDLDDIIAFNTYFRKNTARFKLDVLKDVENIIITKIDLFNKIFDNDSKAHTFHILMSYYFLSHQFHKAYNVYSNYCLLDCKSMEIDSVMNAYMMHIYFFFKMYDEASLICKKMIDNEKYNELNINYKVMNTLNFLILFTYEKDEAKYLEYAKKLKELVDTSKNELYKEKYLNSLEFSFLHHKCMMGLKDDNSPIDIYLKYQMYLSVLSNSDCRYVQPIDLHIDILNYFYQNKLYNETIAASTKVLEIFNVDDIKTIMVNRLILSAYKESGSSKYKDAKHQYFQMLEESNRVYEDERNQMIESKLTFLDTNRKYREFEATYFIDSLTLCHNRNAFINFERNFLNESIEGYVLFFDLDKLKICNDLFGHVQGDKYLKTFSKLLKSYFINNNVFRIGGDEFVVFVNDMSIKKITLLLDKIKKTMNEKSNGFITMKYSCGIAKKELNDDIVETVKHADKLMYICKKEGNWYKF